MPRTLLPRLTTTTSSPSSEPRSSESSSASSSVVERSTSGPARRGVRKSRNPIASACEGCRRAKAKCDGKLPICGRCSKKQVECSNASNSDNLKSLRAVRTDYALAKSNNTKLNDLFTLMATLPEIESQALFARLRSTGDPLKVMRYVAESQLFLSNSDGFSSDTLRDPKLMRIDLESLQASPFRVTARPWTAVAGDGIVSQLISSFFTWDDGFFYPFIHRKAFLDDMQQRNPSTAKYCSPFLVNAICAARYYTARKAKAYSTLSGKDLGIQFLNEAKKMLELEKDTPSIPTAQGLALLFTISAYAGTDRAATMYRIASYDMLRRLDLAARFYEVQSSRAPCLEQEIISKIVWGFFCFESILSHVYNQLALLQPPQIPRLFDRVRESHQQFRGNVDILGNPYESSDGLPPFVPETLDAQCDIALLLYNVMLWNTSSTEGPGNLRRVESRQAMARQVLQWYDSLPRELRFQENFTPQTAYLCIFAHEVVLSILRLLAPDTIVWGTTSAKDAILQCCRIDMEITEQYFKTFSFRDYSPMALRGLYNILLSITGHLQDPGTHDVFVRACRLMVISAADYPMCRFILQGIKAMAWSLKVRLPPESTPYFENLGGSREDLLDVPVGFVLPTDSGRRLLSDKATGEMPGIELGKLLSEWSRLSID